MIDNEYAKAPNPYKRWRKENSKQFKNIYERTVPEISFASAEGLLETITDSSIKNRAKLLLHAGLRYTECDNIHNTRVIGKGAKIREFYAPTLEGEVFRGPYWKFHSALKKIGLKPHTLRKLFATQLAQNGLNEFDLCKVMGWESIETAKSYIAPQRNEVLKKLVEEKIHGLLQTPGTK